MTSTIEREYRQLLRWYPRAWRARQGEDFLGTLLDISADAGRPVLTPRARVALLTMGLVAHLDRLAHPRLRELAATIGLVTGAGISAGIVVVSSWAPGGPGQFDPSSTRFAGLYDLSFIAAAPWLASLVLAALGRWHIGRVLLLVGIPIDLALPHIADVLHAVSTDRTTLLLLAATAVLAALGTPEPHWALAPAATGWAMLTLLGYAERSPRRGLSWQDSADLWSNIAVVWYAAAVALLTAAALAVARRWTAAATITLSLAPLAVTFVLSVIRSELHENGSATLIAAPDAVGLLIIALASSGYLRIPHPPATPVS